MTEEQDDMGPGPDEAAFEAPAPVQEMNTSPQVFDRVFERMTKTGKDAMGSKPVFTRRRVTVTIDGSVCEPDVFVDDEGNYYDFEITLEALGSTQELESMQGVKAPLALASSLAKRSLYALNGRRITKATERDFLWEALGSAGRNLVAMGYAQLSGASEAALGKFLPAFSKP